MALLRICGFEAGADQAGTSDAATALQGTGCSFASGTVRTGNYSLRFLSGTTTGTGYFPLGGSLNSTTGAKSTFSVATLYLRFYLRYVTKPAANAETILEFMDTASALKMRVSLVSTGAIRLINAAGTTLNTSTTTLSANTWYCIEIQCGTSATVGAYELKIGTDTGTSTTSEFSGTGNTGATNHGHIRFGKATNTNSQSIEVLYEDASVNDSVFPGPGKVFRLDPDGVTAATNWTDQGGGTTNLNLSVDDYNAPASVNDGDTTYIVTSTFSAVARMTMEDTGGPVSGDTINGVETLVVCRDESATVAWKPGIEISGSQFFTPNATDGPAAYSGRVKIDEIDPLTSAAWGLTNLQSARALCFHSQAQVRNLRCTSMALMVDYTPAPPAGPISGSCDLSFGGTNTLSGTGALLGAVALTLSATNVLQGAGALLGSNALTISDTGVLLGEGALVGSGALTLSNSGVLLGAGALAGSNALTFTLSAAYISNALIGSAALAFTNTGVLTGSGAIAGTNALTITDTGVLTASGRLLGACALVIGGSGVLAGSGALLGTNTITITGAGLLTGAGRLLGTQTIAFTQAGVLLGAGLLAGTNGLTFTHAGVLSGTGELVGSIALVFTGSATASGGGALGLVGTCSLLITNTGVLLGAGTLVGSQSIAFTQAGVLRGTGAVAGANALLLTQAGVLQGAGSLIGSQALTFSGVGSISGAGALLGSCSLLVTGAGVLRGSGPLAGQASLQFTNVGIVSGSGRLLGSSQLTLSLAGNANLIGTLAGVSSLSMVLVGLILDVGAEPFIFTSLIGSWYIPGAAAGSSYVPGALVGAAYNPGASVGSSYVPGARLGAGNSGGAVTGQSHT